MTIKITRGVTLVTVLRLEDYGDVWMVASSDCLQRSSVHTTSRLIVANA